MGSDFARMLADSVYREQVRARSKRERELASKPLKDYERGLLTLDELIEALESCSNEAYLEIPSVPQVGDVVVVTMGSIRDGVEISAEGWTRVAPDAGDYERPDPDDGAAHFRPNETRHLLSWENGKGESGCPK